MNEFVKTLKVFVSIFIVHLFLVVITFFLLIVLGLGFFDKAVIDSTGRLLMILVFPTRLFWNTDNLQFPFFQCYVFPGVFYSAIITAVIIIGTKIRNVKK